MINWIMKKWRLRQRKIDMEILWPILKEKYSDSAKTLFVYHAHRDTAWTKDYSLDELTKFIDEME